MQTIELPVIDHFVEPTKSAGRPKSNKLSALAAKRNISKKNSTPNERKNVEKDVTDGIAKDTLIKKNGLSASQKLTLSQNFRHMVSQVRPGMDAMMTADLVSLTNGLNCKDCSSNDILKLVHNNPSRGMSLLFPGRSYYERDSMKSLIPPKLFTGLKSDSSFLGPHGVQISCFDFGTSPINDIMMDLRREQEKVQRKKYKTKRLLTPVAHRRTSPKRKSETVDLATVRRLLKKRCKQETAIVPKVVVVGPQGSGKSSLMGKLVHSLDDRLNQKMITKLRWEAQKAGVPHACYAWILDQLESERQFGRSQDVGEIMVEKTADKIYHLFDCPGDIDLMTTNVDLISLADKLVLLVDVNSLTGSESEEEKRMENIIRVFSETSTKHRDFIVVLNKMDQCQWSTAVAVKAVRELEKIMEKTRFSKDNNLVYIPVSSRSSEGIIERTHGDIDLEEELLSSETFAGCLERLTVAPKVTSEPQDWDLRPIVAVVYDTYENMGAGFTAVLLIRDGVLVPGQHLVCFPNGVTAQVRSVQVSRYSKLSPVAAAVRGELVHAVLWHVEFQNVQRGCLLCDSVLAPSSDGMLRKPGLGRGVEVSRRWKAEIHIHDLNGRSVIPGRNIIFHSFSKSCHGYLRRLLWVSDGTDDADSDEGREVSWNPYVVSSANVTLGVELQLDEPHSCLLDKSLNTEFTLFDDCSLFASGCLVDRVPDDVTELPYDLRDLRTMLFHRETEVEDMDIEVDDS